MEKLGQDWDDWTAHDDTYVVDGEDVVVLARYTAVNKATENPSTPAWPTTARAANRPRCRLLHRPTPQPHGERRPRRP
jgi:hypothetical protein